MSEKNREGRCYELAADFVKDQHGSILVHGTLEIGVGGKPIKHAWVICDTGYIWEPVADRFFNPTVFEGYKPIVDHQYTRAETIFLIISGCSFGPWTDGERKRLRSVKPSLLEELEGGGD